MATTLSSYFKQIRDINPPAADALSLAGITDALTLNVENARKVRFFWSATGQVAGNTASFAIAFKAGSVWKWLTAINLAPFDSAAEFEVDGLYEVAILVSGLALDPAATHLLISAHMI